MRNMLEVRFTMVEARRIALAIRDYMYIVVMQIEQPKQLLPSPFSLSPETETFVRSVPSAWVLFLLPSLSLSASRQFQRDGACIFGAARYYLCTTSSIGMSQLAGFSLVGIFRHELVFSSSMHCQTTHFFIVFQSSIGQLESFRTCCSLPSLPSCPTT